MKYSWFPQRVDVFRVHSSVFFRWLLWLLICWHQCTSCFVFSRPIHQLRNPSLPKWLTFFLISTLQTLHRFPQNLQNSKYLMSSIKLNYRRFVSSTKMTGRASNRLTHFESCINFSKILQVARTRIPYKSFVLFFVQIVCCRFSCARWAFCVPFILGMFGRLPVTSISQSNVYRPSSVP